MADPAVVQSFVSELPANIGSALALVPALEWAKRNTWKYLEWINVKTAPTIAVIVAACAAAGIHGVFGQTWDPVTGTWHVEWTIVHLSVLGVLQASVEVGKQWLGQHWIYKGYQALDSLKSVAIAVDRILSVPTPSIPTANTSPQVPAAPVKGIA
jgi:hypothetical protein